MVDLIKQLNTQFCAELNTAWINAIEKSNGKDFSLEIFEEIKTLVFEARDQGYTFNIDYSPNLFIEERIMGKDLEKEFCSMSEWKDVQIILTMIKQSEINKWNFMLPHFKELQKQHLQPIMLKYAINSVKTHGPFFAGPLNEIINVFGFCGSVAAEITLLSIIFGKR